MDRMNGNNACSVTVHLKQTAQVSGEGISFEACRVGSVDGSDGTMILNWNAGELKGDCPAWRTKLAADELSAILFGQSGLTSGEGNAGNVNSSSAADTSETSGSEQYADTSGYAQNADTSGNAQYANTPGREEPSREEIFGENGFYEKTTGADGTVCFSGLSQGAWLIHPEDCTGYGSIEDILIAIPFYEQIGEDRIGPLQSADVWPKADLTSSEIPHDTDPGNPQTEKTEEKETTADTSRETDPETAQTNNGTGKKKTQKQKPGEKTVKETEKKTGETTGNEPGETTGKKTGETTVKKNKLKTPVRDTEKTKDSEKVKVFEHTGEIQDTEKKKPKEQTNQSAQTVTSAQPSREVKTLDDTPLSGLLFIFLSSAILIAFLVRKGRCLKRNDHNMLCLSLLFTMALSMMVFPGVRASASDIQEKSYGQMLEGEKRIVFENESPDTPGLTVSKLVLSALNGLQAPEDAVFTFFLKIDEKPARHMVYRLFSGDGCELVNASQTGEMRLVRIGDAQGMVSALRTASDGSFSLRAGEMALFEDVSQGQLWEVSETDLDHFERISPSTGDTLSGTISLEGASAEFVNRYDPPQDPPVNDTGTLEVSKVILWPDQFSLPEKGRFQIRVTVDGTAWGNRSVRIFDTAAETLLSEDTTDENGIFVISGGQRAELADLPLGSDAKAEELDDNSDLFSPCGETIWNGAIEAQTKVTFTNRLASFSVTKHLSGDITDRSFSFLLKKRDNTAWQGAAYYLYDADGKSVGKDMLRTGEDGHFYLSDGQTAVFAGIADDTVYSVTEERSVGYEQITPEEKEGYSSLRVDGGVRSLVFENKKEPIALRLPYAGGPGAGWFFMISFAGCAAAAAWFHLTGKRKKIV